MQPRSDHQPSEKSFSKKSGLSEEQKSEHLSTRMSTKASGFGFFGCCWKSGDAPSTVAVSKGKLGRPATFMGAQTTLTAGKMSSKSNYKEGSYLRSEPSVVEQESFSSRRYTIDQVFILGGVYKIVTKITVIKVAKATSIIDPARLELKGMNGSVMDPPTRQGSHADQDVKPRSQSGRFSEKEVPKKMKKEIFSKFEKGIKAEEWQEITPEKVAMHVANRLRCDTLVDALCGFGGTAIQFAKTCNFVIGIDIKGTKTAWAKHNAKIYGVENKIDFITGDFMKIRNLTGDIVFLGPTIEPSKPERPFSLFENIKPDPLSLLSKSLQVSYKIALQLPGNTQLEELPQLFHQSLEKYDSYSKRFCIEIEKIVNSHNETECIMVYFGDCSSINVREEYEAIYEYISTFESPQWKREFPFQVITTIIDKIGIRRTFKYLSEVERQLSSIHESSLFGAFLHKLTQEAILSQANLNRIIEEESRKNEWAGVNNNSYSSGSVKTYTNMDLNQSLRVEPMSRNPSRVGGMIDSQEKPKGLLSRLVTETKTLRGHSHMADSRFKSPALPKDEKLYSPCSPPSILENINGTLKNSYDMSELAVSSYSVSSDYLKDSSEDGDSSRQLFMGENIDNLTDPSPHNSSLTMVEKPFRHSEGGRKKERASSHYLNDIKPLDGDLKGKKDKKWKEEVDKKDNRSFLLQCGDEF